MWASRFWAINSLTPRIRKLTKAANAGGLFLGRNFLFASEITIDTTTLLVVIIVFVATLIRSAFGFGEGLLAVPLLAFFIPLEVAAPLAVLVSITIAAIVVVQDWKKIHLRSAGWLVLSTLFGIPLGLLLLTSGHQRALKATLGLIIVGFAVYSLMGDETTGLGTPKLEPE